MNTKQTKSGREIKNANPKPKCSVCGKPSRISTLPAGWKLVCKTCDAAQTNLSSLKPEHQKFVQNVASGMNQTEAYQDAYPQVSYDVARVNASRLLTNANISAALQVRVQRNLSHAQTSHDEIIGSAVRQMRSSIDDVLNDEGFFDLEKARETGGIDFVKKLKITERVIPGINAKERTCEVEMYSSAEGRRDAANYTGLEKAPRSPAEPPGIQLNQYLQLAEKWVERGDFETKGEALEFMVTENPQLRKPFIEQKLLTDSAS
jgi:phage terminase small subunit